MRIAALAAICLAATVAHADQTFDLKEFTSVEVREGVSVIIIAGAEFSINAKAAIGSLDRLNVDKFGQWLVFSRDARWGPFPNWRQDKFEVVVTLPVLAEVKSFDHAAVTVTGITTDEFRAEVGGESDLILDAGSFGALTLVINTGGSLTVAGACDALIVEGAGGTINAPDLTCDAAEIDAKADVMLDLSPETRIVDTVAEE